MKRILLFTAISLASTSMFAQQQIGNSDMENWSAVSSGEEPDNWNSFMTADGGFNGFADVQVEQSTDTRPGTSGTTSARIWARNAGFGITANGNLTLGRINMGAISASSPDNYNFTQRDDGGSPANPTPEFSEALTDSPDSIVFWAKFNAQGATEEARMKATLHTDYNYRDPEDAASSNEVVATAVVNFLPTGGWVRMSIPFDYSGPASVHDYILVTFTTNKVPGGGDPNDELFIDDVELIYNPNGVEELVNNMKVFMNNESSELTFKSTQTFDGVYSVIDLSGKTVQTGQMLNTVPFNAPSGMYIVNIDVNGESKQYKIYKK